MKFVLKFLYCSTPFSFLYYVQIRLSIFFNFKTNTIPILLFKVYEATGLVSPLLFKGYEKLNSAQKLEWNNR